MITNRQLVYKCISQLSQRQRNGGNLAPAGAGCTTLDFMQTRYSFVYCISWHVYMHANLCSQRHKLGVAKLVVVVVVSNARV